MSRKIGNIFLSYPEAPQVCEFCGQVAETRPYGKDGKEICFDCSQEPENKNDVEENFKNILEGKKRMPMRNDMPVE